MATIPRRFLVLSAALGLAVLLGGCATPSPGSAPTPSESSSSDDDEGELDAAWLDHGSAFAVVTMGSSSCAPSAGEATAEGQTVTVELIPPAADTACTRDMAPRATMVALPEGVDPTRDVDIIVTGDEVSGTAQLEGEKSLKNTGASTDYAPSAGWLNDDSFVILTWGSSTCVPVIETVETAGRDALAVKFVDPPDDQVCTMDMAPRTTIASTAGLDMDDIDGDKVSLTLTGDSFDTTIQILGER